MTRQPNPAAITMQRSYDLPPSKPPLSCASAIVGALEYLRSEERVFVNYRINPNTRFEPFQGVLPGIANKFIGVARVDIQLESMHPISDKTAQQFFSALERELQEN